MCKNLDTIEKAVNAIVECHSKGLDAPKEYLDKLAALYKEKWDNESKIIKDGKPLKYTNNDAISMMHRQNADAFRNLANHIEKHRMGWVDIVEFMRESADEMEAQAMVVDLRDKL